MEENTKVTIWPKYNHEEERYGNVTVYIDDNEYDSVRTPEQFGDFVFNCLHESNGWSLQVAFKFEEGKTYRDGWYTLQINNTYFYDLPGAPERERAFLARSKITYRMDGPIK